MKLKDNQELELYSAIISRNEDESEKGLNFIKKKIQNGCDVNFKLIEYNNNESKVITLIQLAIKHNNVPIIKYLLKQGADLYMQPTLSKYVEWPNDAVSCARLTFLPLSTKDLITKISKCENFLFVKNGINQILQCKPEIIEIFKARLNSTALKTLVKYAALACTDDQYKTSKYYSQNLNLPEIFKKSSDKEILFANLTQNIKNLETQGSNALSYNLKRSFLALDDDLLSKLKNIIDPLTFMKGNAKLCLFSLAAKIVSKEDILKCGIEGIIEKYKLPILLQNLSLDNNIEFSTLGNSLIHFNEME